MKFYICNHCGNLIIKVVDKGVPVVCCGEKMTEVVPNTTDAAAENHVPAVTVEGGGVTVAVGSLEHPMLPEHFITNIILETSRGHHLAAQQPGDKPRAVFLLPEGETPVAAYEYCNLHGLWKAEI